MINGDALIRINYNMRCIETKKQLLIRRYHYDKLQHEMYWNLII